MRFAARTDENHEAIVRAFRKVGAWVWSTAALGSGFPDLLVCVAQKFVLVEVKDGLKIKSKQRLTERQVDFARMCPGPLLVVRSCADAVALVNRIRLEMEGAWDSQ